METKGKTAKIKKFTRGERTLEILEAIGKLSAIMAMGILVPNAAGHIIKLLGWVPDSKSRYRTERAIESLEKRKLVSLWAKDGRGGLRLTNEGRIHLAGLKAKSIKLPSGKRWDGFWRMVTFDIPEKLKINRQRFNRALSFAGMHNLEKSMFVYPHECKEQVLKIAELYEVKKYVRYIKAVSIEPEFGLKIFFPYTKSPTTVRSHHYGMKGKKRNRKKGI